MTQRRWTPSEIDALRAAYPDTPTDEVVRALGHPRSSVYAKAKSLGLRKSAAFMASDRSGRLQRGETDPRRTRTQFQAGHAAWNKGKAHPPRGRSAEKQFKSRAPEESRNYRPIGSLRVCADGYLEQKVTDDKSLVPARRWVAVHRLVWQRDVGPIPAGHVVVFRPGQRTAVLEEVVADRLECITRAELQRRNSIHTRLPPEVRALYVLKGAITRQVNRITKESEE